jgi:hypothetical protein
VGTSAGLSTERYVMESFKGAGARRWSNAENARYYDQYCLIYKHLAARFQFFLCPPCLSCQQGNKGLNRLLAKSLFTGSKPFFSRLVGIRQDFLAKNVLMTAQMDLCLGNSPQLLNGKANILSNFSKRSLLQIRPLLKPSSITIPLGFIVSKLPIFSCPNLKERLTCYL